MSYSWGAGRGTARTARPPALRAVSGGGTVVDLAASGAGEAGEHQRLAAELAPMVDVWERLLLQHVPDRTGRCRTCTKGGTGLPSTPWPCSIHGLADMARRSHGGH